MMLHVGCVCLGTCLWVWIKIEVSCVYGALILLPYHFFVQVYLALGDFLKSIFILELGVFVSLYRGHSEKQCKHINALHNDSKASIFVDVANMDPYANHRYNKQNCALHEKHYMVLVSASMSEMRPCLLAARNSMPLRICSTWANSFTHHRCILLAIDVQHGKREISGSRCQLLTWDWSHL